MPPPTPHGAFSANATSRHHTAHLWRFATPYGSPMALRAIRLVLRLWRPSGDAIRLRRTAMLALPAATRRAYAVPARYALVACGNVASIRRACALCSRCLRQRGEHTRALKAPHWGAFFAYSAPLGTPYGSFSAYGAPLGTPYGSAARLCSRCLRQRGEHMPCTFNRLQSPFCRRN